MKTARLFLNGGSQAVRLPAEYRFSGDEVFIRRDKRTGDVVLSNKNAWNTWDEYLRLRRKGGSNVQDFMKDRPMNVPFPAKLVFDPES